MWYVTALLWLAMIAGIAWFYRRRRQRYLDASARRMEALLMELKRDPQAPDTQKRAGAVPPAAAAAAPCTKRPRLLAPEQALLYHVFRTGLPGHEIFPRLTLAEVVDLNAGQSAGLREQAPRAAHYKLDLVICTRQLEVIGVAVLKSASALDADQTARFAAHCLETAGIRLVQIDPARLPRHQDVRALVYGGAEPAAQK